MRQSLLVVALMFCFSALSTRAQPVTPNLSGTWNLDVTKSDFGQMPTPDSMIQVIDHHEPKIRIVTTVKSSMGDSSGEESFTTDGSETTATVRVSGIEREITSVGKWDAGKLKRSMKFETQGTIIEFNDSFAVSEDGKILTLVRIGKTPQGELTARMIFNKQ